MYMYIYVCICFCSNFLLDFKTLLHTQAIHLQMRPIHCPFIQLHHHQTHSHQTVMVLFSHLKELVLMTICKKLRRYVLLLYVSLADELVGLQARRNPTKMSMLFSQMILQFFFLFVFKLVKSVLEKKPAGEKIFQEYKTTGKITDSTRRILVNALVGDMIDKYGWVKDVVPFPLFKYLDNTVCE